MAVENWPSNSGGTINPKVAGALGTLGARRQVDYYDPITGALTGEQREEIFLYNATGAATIIGDAYALAINSTSTAQVLQAIVLAALALPREVVIATSVIAAAGYGWFALSGPVNATLHGAIAANAHVKVTTGTSTRALVTDTTGTATSVGINGNVAAPGGTPSVPTAAVPNKIYLRGSHTVIA